MKILLICILIAPIIYLALKQKKWYLYLLISFIGFLPEQFALQLHDKLPLISGSRILILLAAIFWAWDKWKTKKFRFPISLIAFGAVNLIISFINFRYGTDEINRIFRLLFERLLVVIMIADMLRTKEEFDTGVDFLIMSGVALAVIGIVQTVFEYDIASVLHLTKTMASVSIANRMELVRAYGTYNAISFGCYCAFLSVITLYRLMRTRHVLHMAALALILTALICTLTRSAWLCLAIILLFMLVVFRMRLIRPLLCSIGMTLALCAVLLLFQPNLSNAFVETGKSALNAVLEHLPEPVVDLLFPQPQQTPSAEVIPTDPTEDPTAPSQTEETTVAEQVTEPAATTTKPKPGFVLSDRFGLNASSPTYSRNAQWTAVKYMHQEGKLLFGYGYNALAKGRIHFFYDKWDTDWHPTTYLDVGLIMLFADGGLIGVVSYMGLLGYMAVQALRKKEKLKKNPPDFYWMVLFMIPLYLLLNYMSAFLFPHVVWVFIGLFYAYMHLEKEPSAEPEEPSEETSAQPLIPAETT